MRYELLCKDDVRARFEIRYTYVEELIINEVCGTLPIGQTAATLLTWIRSRNAVKHRKHLQDFLRNIGADDLEGFLAVTHAISLNDVYWVRREDEILEWSAISPYRNTLNSVIAECAFIGEDTSKGTTERNVLCNLTSSSAEYSTEGNFNKCWINDSDAIYLIKRGSVNSHSKVRRSGREPYCEVLASQVYQKMKAGIKYSLLRYKGAVASKCRLFNTESMSFAPYKIVQPAIRDITEINKYMMSLPMGEIYRRILVSDALVLNIDRHAGNFGVFYDSITNDICSCAIGFDYNLSLMPYATDGEFEHLSSVLEDYKPYFGDDFIATARYALTDSIRDDLINLRGIDLTLPFYDEIFPEKRAKWLTDIVNYQIDNILHEERKAFYPAINKNGLSNCELYKQKLKMSDEEFRRRVPKLLQHFNVSTVEALEKNIITLID